jgi:hypothetical protein
LVAAPARREFSCCRGCGLMILAAVSRHRPCSRRLADRGGLLCTANKLFQTHGRGRGRPRIRPPGRFCVSTAAEIETAHQPLPIKRGGCRNTDLAGCRNSGAAGTRGAKAHGPASQRDDRSRGRLNSYSCVDRVCNHSQHVAGPHNFA